MSNQHISRTYKYVSTKEYHDAFPCAYRQWRADSHCNLIHGYSFSMKFYFGTDHLDIRNWVADYGGLKELKKILEDQFDHTLLVAQDDPEFKTFEDLHNRKLCKMVVVERTGCEGLSKFLADYIQGIWMEENGYGDGRVRLRMVKVMETPSNSAMWVHEGV